MKITSQQQSKSETLMLLSSLAINHLPKKNASLDAELFLNYLDWHQLAPLITASTSDIDQYLTRSVAQDVYAAKRRIAASSLHTCNELTRIITTLNAAQIRVMSLKGPLLAQQLYGSETKRYCHDLDLLIDLDEALATAECLISLGYQPKFPAMLDEGQFRQYAFLAKDMSFYNEEKDILVELHWRLMVNPELLPLGFSELWQNSNQITMGHCAVNIPDATTNALYLACHGAVTNWTRLKWVADFNQVLLSGDVNWQAVRQLSNNLNTDRMLKNAVDNATYWFQSEVPGELMSLAPTSSRLLASNLQSQIECRNASTVKGSINILTLLGSVSGIWQQYRRVLGTSVLDLVALKLPAPLFPLYYLLRPFIFIGRRFGIIG